MAPHTAERQLTVFGRIDLSHLHNRQPSPLTLSCTASSRPSGANGTPYTSASDPRGGSTAARAVSRPADMFDREWEWRALVDFSTDTSPGATLGVVSGRRRQGKTMLLQSLAEQAGGFFFEAVEGQPAE